MSLLPRAKKAIRLRERRGDARLRHHDRQGMAGAPSHPEVRSKVESGELAGPRLYVAAPPVHSGNTPDEEAAREKVAAAKAAGFDLIKSHHIEDPKIWDAVQQEAAKQGLATGGHVAGGRRPASRDGGESADRAYGRRPPGAAAGRFRRTSGNGGPVPAGSRHRSAHQGRGCRVRSSGSQGEGVKFLPSADARAVRQGIRH